jgi:menaquinone-dependent protoporphyrinogen oxidase
MTKYLFLYSTTDGHTKRICEYIGNILKQQNHEIKIEPISLELKKLSEYDAIILGASIRYGKHQKSVFNFINKHKDLLETKKSAFFSVNVVARKSEKNSPNTNPYMKKFLKTSNWQPNKLGVFAGKVDYPSYKFFDKYIIKMIMWITKGPTDTSQSYEFTDWKVVENFAKTL